MKLPLRWIGALVMVAVVHLFIVGFGVPSSYAWWIGGMIYAGLVGVLFSRYPLLKKLGVYFTFLVVTVVGALTVCPCTGAHLFFAPLAGLLALILFHVAVRRPLSKRTQPSAPVR